MNDYFIRELRSIYKKRQLIPFIGAGLSIPFGVPGWGKLIMEYAMELDVHEVDLIKLVEIDLGNNDYWEALRTIKKYAKEQNKTFKNIYVKRYQAV